MFALYCPLSLIMSYNCRIHWLRVEGPPPPLSLLVTAQARELGTNNANVRMPSSPKPYYLSSGMAFDIALSTRS